MYNIKIGPGDEANLEVDEPHDYDTVLKGGGWVFDGAAKCTKVDNYRLPSPSRNRPYIGGHLAIYFQIEFKHV